jgi:ferredoxin
MAMNNRSENQRASGGLRLRVDPIACRAHGICAEVAPELVTLDEWGYPVVIDEPVPGRLAGEARRAAADCPALALRLDRGASGWR